MVERAWKSSVGAREPSMFVTRLKVLLETVIEIESSYIAVTRLYIVFQIYKLKAISRLDYRY